MPDGKKYKVTSPEGKQVTFTWNGETDPTEADLQEVFDQAKSFTPSAAPTPVAQAPIPPNYGQRVSAATHAPGQTLEKAFGQFASGNPIAGVANVANAGAGMLGAAVSPLTEAPWIGQGAKNVLGFVPWLAERAAHYGEAGIQTGLNATGNPNPFQGKLTQAQQDEAAQAMHGLNANVATVPAGEALAKAGGAALAPLSEEARQASLRGKIVGNLKRIAPPTRNELDWGEAADRALPYLKQQNAITPVAEGEGAVRSLGEIASQAKQGVFDKYNSVVQEHPEITIGEGTSIPDEIRSSAITPSIRKLYPAKAEAISEFADKFAGTMPVPEAFDHLKTLNADLNAYYKMSPEGRAAADATGVPTAAKAAAAEVLRKQSLDALENNSVSGVEEARKDYGAIGQMQKAIERNVVKAEKPSAPFLAAGMRTGPLWITALGDMLAGQAGLGPAGSIGIGVAAGLGAEALRKYNSPNSIAGRLSDQLSRVHAAVPDVTYTRPPFLGPPSSGGTGTPPAPETPIVKPPWLRGGGGAGPEEIAETNIRNAGMRFDGLQNAGGKTLAYFTDTRRGSPTNGYTLTRDVNDLLEPASINEILQQKAAAGAR